MTPEQLLDEALAIRAEGTITGICPRCGRTKQAAGVVDVHGQSALHIQIVHTSWCPASDQRVETLAARAKAKTRHVPILDEANRLVHLCLARDGAEGFGIPRESPLVDRLHFDRERGVLVLEPTAA